MKRTCVEQGASQFGFLITILQTDDILQPKKPFEGSLGFSTILKIVKCFYFTNFKQLLEYKWNTCTLIHQMKNIPS